MIYSLNRNLSIQNRTIEAFYRTRSIQSRTIEAIYRTLSTRNRMIESLRLNFLSQRADIHS
jgi:hypothetical protein